MKKLDLVKLKNDKPYKTYNLVKGMHGIVVELNFDNADVLFFNPQNVGDYAIVNVKTMDLDLDKEKLPTKFEKELLLKLDDIIAKARNEIQPIKIEEYDMVELLVEEDRYTLIYFHKLYFRVLVVIHNSLLFVFHIGINEYSIWFIIF